MSIIDDIIAACEIPDDMPIKNFGVYKISKLLGKGQQGVVVKITNQINKSFALKFYRPTDRSEGILRESLSRFRNEANTLASLSHCNIVKIYTGGVAKFNTNLWDVQEGFLHSSSNGLEENEFYYYIMDFIKGHDLTQIFPELSTDHTGTNESLTVMEKLKYFELLVKQVCNGMTYYHAKLITHKDIKPENIRYSSEDNTFIIVDFGFAHHTSSPQSDEVFPITRYIDFPSIDSKDYQKNDMGQFSKMLASLLPSFKNAYQKHRYSGIEAAISRGMNPNLRERFNNMSDFYNAIKSYFIFSAGWRFQLKLDEFLTPSRFGRFDSKLRIPVSGSILLNAEVRELIDSAQFQRLRGVRQLGPTMFVFPGANHTRFEHSLGVYFLSLRYLEKLLGLAEFRSICEPLDESIKLIVLSSLLHDIGHYPYSHWVEEIDELPSGIKLKGHEERAADILCHGEIAQIITDKWNVDVNIISEVITNKSDKDLINSFINSIVDIDKLDYLARDSVHCGINYGKGIDVERLLDSLFVNAENGRLCITEKGKSALLSILTTRNIMYQEVYWHKTVRACEAMFKRFFYEYVNELVGIGKENTINKLNELFNLSDDEYITILYHWAKSQNKAKLVQLISPFAFMGRHFLYKPCYIYHEHIQEGGKIDSFFRKVFKSSYSDLIETSQKLVANFRRYIPDLDDLDILVEKTPIKSEGEHYVLDGFKVYNSRKGKLEPHPFGIDALNNYLSSNRQAYIFCNPNHYVRMREMIQREGLGNLISGT